MGHPSTTRGRFTKPPAATGNCGTFACIHDMQKAAPIRQDLGRPHVLRDQSSAGRNHFMMSHTFDVVSLPEQNVVSLAEEKRARIAAETEGILNETLLLLRRVAEVRDAVDLPLDTNGFDLSVFVAVA